MKPITKYFLLTLLLIQGILVSALGPGSLIGDGVGPGITGQVVEHIHPSSGGDEVVQKLTLKDLISSFSRDTQEEWVGEVEDPGGPCAAKLLEQLKKDLKDYPELDAWLKSTPKPHGVNAYIILSEHPKLRIKKDVLEKAASVIQKGHVSVNDMREILRVNSGLGERAEAVAKLLDDLDHFALYQQAEGFGSVISGLKADWFNGAGADGANWVIAAIKNKGTGVFPPSSTRFEVNSILGSQRRYDAVVSQAGQPKKFYEFKSYKSVPPANFENQFINDLNNPEITNLSQLKWIFDAAKNPPNFETNMKAAIDALNLSVDNIPIATLQKLGVSNEAGLRIILEQNFSSIFNLN